MPEQTRRVDPARGTPGLRIRVDAAFERRRKLAGWSADDLDSILRVLPGQPGSGAL